MKILTSFTKLNTAEGQRISYTYSEIGDDGVLISQNNRENFIVVKKELSDAIEIIESCIKDNYMLDSE